jgi:hypothetical protein
VSPTGRRRRSPHRVRRDESALEAPGLSVHEAQVEAEAFLAESLVLVGAHDLAVEEAYDDFLAFRATGLSAARSTGASGNVMCLTADSEIQARRLFPEVGRMGTSSAAD